MLPRRFDPPSVAVAQFTPNTYPIELEALDITAYRAGNTGVDYVTTFDSGRGGPHVLIAAVVHGNELCGVHALDFLFRHDIRPQVGRLTLAFMNHVAYGRFDRAQPNASRFVDEDFNRLWSDDVLDGPRDSVELRRARQVRPIVADADYLLDIHSMQHRTAPLIMAGVLAKGRDLARRVGAPQLVVSDQGHEKGRRMRDYGAFAVVGSARNALLVECGQHWEAGSRVVAIDTTLRFLRVLGVVNGAAIDAHLTPETPPAQRFIEVTHAVTIRSNSFEFLRDFKGMELIPKEGTEIARDGGELVRTPYDDCILIMPSSRLNEGQTAVRLGRYVDAG